MVVRLLIDFRVGTAHSDACSEEIIPVDAVRTRGDQSAIICLAEFVCSRCVPQELLSGDEPPRGPVLIFLFVCPEEVLLLWRRARLLAPADPFAQRPHVLLTPAEGADQI